MENRHNTIGAARQVVQVLPANHADRPTALALLAAQLYGRGTLSDIDEAIELTREALHLGSPTRQGLVKLAVYFHGKFDITDADSDLDEAIAIIQQAVASTPPEHPSHPLLLHKSAIWLVVRYNRSKSLPDLNEAIRVQRSVLELGSEDHKDRLSWLNTMASLLSRRFEAEGKQLDIDEAVQISRNIAATVPVDSPVRILYLSNLGQILNERYSRIADPSNVSDQEEAIQITKQLADSLPDDSRDLVRVLNNYTTFLGDRFLRTGALSDLEEALQSGERVLTLLRPDDQNRAVILSNTAIQLSRRYELIGTRADLDRALAMGKEAVSVSSGDDQFPCQHNLAILLKLHHHITESLDELNEAIHIQQQAIEITPADHRDLHGYLHNLCCLLMTHYRQTEDEHSLQEASDIAGRILETIPSDHPSLAAYWNTCGVILYSFYIVTHDKSMLDHVIWIQGEVLNLTDDDDPQSADRLVNIASSLYDRFKTTQSRDDLDKATEYYQSALQHVPSSVVSRINAGRGLLKCYAAISDWPQAYQAAVSALQLVPKLTSRLLTTRDRQDTLSQLTGLASEAAAVALHAGEGEVAALRCLEQARGLLQTSLEKTSFDILQLRSRHPELADQFIRLRDALGDKRVATGVQVSGLEIQAMQRREGNDALDAVILQIRQEPGFESFLLGFSDREFREAAVEGPLIVINPSDHGCHAILIEQHQIRSMELTSISLSELKEKIRNDNLESQRTLEWLWTAIAEPILNFLDIKGATNSTLDDSNMRRVWWIPMGLMTIMPFHAAGRHFVGSTDTVLDRTMSSYSSSVKLLVLTRQRMIARPASVPIRGKALLVAVTKTPGYNPLKGAANEVSMLRAICEEMDMFPMEPRPWKEDVLEHLSDCEIFHFAGHGYTDEHDPSESCLLFEDLSLSLATLQELDLRERAPFLAYLSACGTGLIRHERFLDESLHLISGYQMVGFRHVVGTLWRVDDDISAEVAKLTYEGLRDDKSHDKMTEDSVCRGLHRATRVMRDRWVKSRDLKEGVTSPFRATTEVSSRHTLPDVVSGVRTKQDVLSRKIIDVDDEDEDERQSYNVDPLELRSFIQDQERGVASRTIVADDDEEEEPVPYDSEPLQWIPYVHYGL